MLINEISRSQGQGLAHELQYVWRRAQIDGERNALNNNKLAGFSRESVGVSCKKGKGHQNRAPSLLEPRVFF